MLDKADIRIDIYRNTWGPQTIKLIHLPTGVVVERQVKDQKFLLEHKTKTELYVELEKAIEASEKPDG